MYAHTHTATHTHTYTHIPAQTHKSAHINTYVYIHTQPKYVHIHDMHAFLWCAWETSCMFVSICVFICEYTHVFKRVVHEWVSNTKTVRVCLCVQVLVCRHVWVQAHFQTSRKQVSIQLTPLNKTGRPIRNQSWAPAPPSKKQRHQQHSSTNDTEMCTTPKPRQVYFCVKSLGKNKCNTFARFAVYITPHLLLKLLVVFDQ